MSGFNGKRNVCCKKKNGAWGRKNYDDRLIRNIDRRFAEQAVETFERGTKIIDRQKVKLRQLLDEAGWTKQIKEEQR